MIEDGCLENPSVDYIYGIHLWSYEPLGVIGCSEGAQYLACISCWAAVGELAVASLLTLVLPCTQMFVLKASLLVDFLTHALTGALVDDVIVFCHVLCEGPIMAASDKFHIDVLGKGGHGAAPHGTFKRTRNCNYCVHMLEVEATYKETQG